MKSTLTPGPPTTFPYLARLISQHNIVVLMTGPGEDPKSNLAGVCLHGSWGIGYYSNIWSSLAGIWEPLPNSITLSN